MVESGKERRGIVLAGFGIRMDMKNGRAIECNG
jgi:ribosomal protein L34